MSETVLAWLAESSDSPIDPQPSIREAPANPYKLERSTIITDLTTERPQWILSAYGPGLKAPEQLFGGHPREQSFEELRLRHFELAAQGNQQEAIQEAQVLVSNAEQQMQTALNDIDGAIKYIVDGDNRHPNRIDICQARIIPSSQQPNATQQPTSTSGQPPAAAPSFGQPSAPSVFGRPSAPTFGQPSAPTSGFSQSSAPAFGQPAFGQPPAPDRPTTSFGQPSIVGSPSTLTPSLGQPSAPSSFIAPQQAHQAGIQSNHPFGQTSTQAPTTTFGQPSAPTQGSVFGRPSAGPSASPFNQSAASAMTAGGPAQTTAPQSNPFGNPTPTAPTNAFGQPTRASPSPFGQPPSTQQPNAFAQRATPPANNAAVRSAAAPGSGPQIQKDGQGRLRSWNGKTVSYINDEPCYKRNDGSWEKIWFPEGPPEFKKTVDLPDEVYDQATKENYMFLKEHGMFKDGIMPLLPPKREWCNWNV